MFRSTVRLLVQSASALTFLIAPANAQRTNSTIDLGGSAVRFSDSTTTRAASLSPAISLDLPRATLAAAATLSRDDGSAWSTQGSAAATLFTPAAGIFLGELTASAGGSTHAGLPSTGQGLATARLHAMGALSGAWIGGGLGVTNDGFGSHSFVQAELGSWLRRRRVTALGSVTPVFMADSTRYTDGEFALRFDTRSAEMGATLGARFGDPGLRIGGERKVWGTVGVAWWVMPRAALVLSAGTYPVDVAQQFPGGSYASVALRLSTRSHYGSVERIVAAPAPEAPESQLKLSFTRASSQNVRLVVSVRNAERVDIMGDFTRWEPLRLAPGSGGSWVASLHIPNGVHQLNVRVNGGPWVVPDGLAVVDDEFGGRVGLLVIE